MDTINPKEKQEKNVPIEMLESGTTIVKMENTVQMQLAVQRPRNEARILSEALKELDLYPSMAREAIYVKPVGKDENKQMKYAEGLSIRAAESLGNRWENSSYGTAIIGEDDESARIAAVFLDYQGNTRHVTERRVSKFYKSRYGQVTRYSPDRFDVVVSAHGSKILREVILRSLPAGLKKEYETKARGILKKEPIENQRKALIERFINIGISIDKLERWKEKPIDQWKREDIIEGLGLVNAIRDGEVSLEEIFGNGKLPEEQSLPGLKPIENQEEKHRGRLTGSKNKPKDVMPRKVKCPNTGEEVDISACESCPNREGCPAWEA